MPVYQTPGVYYERVDASSPGIFAIRTDVAGFVGIASRGPLHQAVPVQSWRQFQAYFGGFTGAGYLAYAVWAFFQNGGVRCWVVRVSSDLAATAEYTLSSAPPLGGPAWRLSAFSPGVWGNDLDVQVKETHRGETLTAGAGTPEYSAVASLAGFGRGTLVRLTQQSVTALKIVSEVDAGEGNPAGEKRIYWVNRKPETRRHFWADFGSGVQSYYDDTPLSGFDPALPILLQSVEYTLLVRELGRLVRVYQDVSTVPDHERYGPRLLPPLAPVKETDLGKFALAPEPVVIEELRDPQGGLAEWLGTLAVDPELAIQLVGGADGLAFLGVNDFIGEELSPLDSDLVRQRKQRGLRALEQVSEVAILAVPDIQIRPYQPPGKAPLPPCIPEPCLPAGPPQPAPPRTPAVGDLPPLFSEQEIFQVQAACVQQCEERRDRLALLDPPFAAARDDAQGVGALLGWRRRFDSKYAAFYYPWLRVVDPLHPRGAVTRDIPPSGHVAGQYALTDLEQGVHKAPANAPLQWAQDVTAPVSEEVHGVVNGAGVNAIRPLPGRGLRIYGARTVSSDPDWRFVNVRRLMMMIEKAIYLSTQWAAFEPNDTLTRAKLRLSLTSFLLSLWQRGALMGASAEEAFYVKCDDANNPESERGNGKLLAEVGVAPSQPFEFVVLRVGRTNNEWEITEASGSGGGSL